MSSVCDSYWSRNYHNDTGSRVALSRNPVRFNPVRFNRRTLVPRSSLLRSATCRSVAARLLPSLSGRRRSAAAGGRPARLVKVRGARHVVRRARPRGARRLTPQAHAAHCSVPATRREGVQVGGWTYWRKGLRGNFIALFCFLNCLCLYCTGANCCLGMVGTWLCC